LRLAVLNYSRIFSLNCS